MYGCSENIIRSAKQMYTSRTPCFLILVDTYFGGPHPGTLENVAL
jgi:hypothetical protein